MYQLPTASALRRVAMAGMTALALTAAGIARADELQTTVAESLAPAGLPAPAESSVLATLGAASAITDEALGSESAMARIELAPVVINDQTVNGVVEGNVATGNITGHNSITDNAFAGASGFSTAIQNSGNNVLIQNSTIINVSLDP